MSPSQLSLLEYDSGFGFKLDANNRWVILAKKIPWDDLVSVYNKRLRNQSYGASGINSRVALGALIIKHICDLSDREVIQQIRENMYMQYFVGLPVHTNEALFDPSLFVDIRKRLGVEQINAINEKILGIQRKSDTDGKEGEDSDQTPRGELLMDATACPQDIAYPTDLNLLHNACQKSEELIDKLHERFKLDVKPRIYRKIARKEYLKGAQKKQKTKSEIRRCIRKQLGYLKRNLSAIQQIIDANKIPFDRIDYKYWLVIQTLYNQQKQMFDEK